MKLDESTVDRIAYLSKLEFNKEEKKAILNDMNQMLSFIETLQEVDTEKCRSFNTYDRRC